MLTIRIEKGSSVESNIKKYLDINDSILHMFEIVPLDYRVDDYLTPRLYISTKRVFISFDEVLEIYDLNNLEIGLVGDKPGLTIFQLLLERTIIYSFDNRSELEKLKLSETLTRLSLNEPNQVPKYFILRSGMRTQKSIKSWALMQLLRNIKIGKYENNDIIEIISGYFSTFNQKTILLFILGFLVYLGLRIVFSNSAEIILTILNIVFGVIIALFGVWTLLSVNKNLKKYKGIYISYSSPN